MAKTENVELTVLCLICKGDQILLQNRVKKDWCGYTLPGGHVEPGESVVDAVIREMKEETGLTVESPRLCGIKQFPTADGRYLVFLFRTDRFRGELASSAEGEVAWFCRKDLGSLHTVDDLAQLLSVFDDDTHTEFIYAKSGEDWEVIIK